MNRIEYKFPYINRLYREVNHQIRYYTLQIYKTLFGEYILEKKYGSIKNKRPTGVKREFFLSLGDAVKATALQIEAKLKRGYTLA